MVARELERLPANQRAVVTLRDVEGWAADEVCAAVGVTAANERARAVPRTDAVGRPRGYI